MNNLMRNPMPFCANNIFYRNFLSMEPDLQGLKETEVFVGEDDMLKEKCDEKSISYKDGFLHSLNSVEEDVEAEAAAEEQVNFHSLDYLSLSIGASSSGISSMDDILKAESYPNSLPFKSHLTPICKKMHSSKDNLMGKPIEVIGKDTKCKLKTNKLDVKPSSCSSKNSPRIFPHCVNCQNKEEYIMCDRSSCKGTPSRSCYTVVEKFKMYSEKKYPIWHNPSRSDKILEGTKSNIKKRNGLCRTKSELREYLSNNDDKYSSLPRRRKEKSDKDIAAETYGTLGKNRKLKEASTNDHSYTNKLPVQEKCYNELPLESKNILDKYATLPRKKAKEMSARWRESRDKSISKDKKDTRPPVHSSRQKSENSQLNKVSPSSSSSSVGQSPRVSSHSKQSTRSVIKPKVNNSSTTRLVSRQSSLVKDKKDKNLSSRLTGKLSKTTKKNVEIQVNIKWDPNENELEDKLRTLEVVHHSLQQRVKIAEAAAEEVEQLRMEGVELRRIAEMEKMEKEELQEELDKTSEKVKDMLKSMEGVEREFNNRGESLIELENQLENSAEVNIKMQDKINQYEEYIVKLRKDSDKSLAAQKILLQQVQDLEAEGREMVEFMAEEKNALSECLKEAESETCRMRSEIEQLKRNLEMKDKEMNKKIILSSNDENSLSLPDGVDFNTEDIMVYQGADISGASVGLTNLASRLQILTDKLIQDFRISENDIENVVTPLFSFSSNDPINESPGSIYRRNSILRPGSFLQSFINALMAVQNSSKLLATSFTNKKDVLFNEESNATSKVKSTPSFLDQVTEIDRLLTRFLKVCCVLKSDADHFLSELEDINEHMCTQLQLQQQVIDEQNAGFESLSAFESDMKKEIKMTIKSIDCASQNLSKNYDKDTRVHIQNVESEFLIIKSMMAQIEQLLETKQARMTQALQSANQESNFNNLQLLLMSKTPSLKEKNEDMIHFNDVFDSKVDNGSINLGDSSFECDSKLEESEDNSHEIDYIVNHVLKTLETVPDVVSCCAALRNLYIQLNAKGPFEDKLNCFSNTSLSNENNLLSSTSPSANPLSINNSCSSSNSELSAASCQTCIIKDELNTFEVNGKSNSESDHVDVDKTENITVNNLSDVENMKEENIFCEQFNNGSDFINDVNIHEEICSEKLQENSVQNTSNLSLKSVDELMSPLPSTYLETNLDKLESTVDKHNHIDQSSTDIQFTESYINLQSDLVVKPVSLDVGKETIFDCNANPDIAAGNNLPNKDKQLPVIGELSINETSIISNDSVPTSSQQDNCPLQTALPDRSPHKLSKETSL